MNNRDSQANNRINGLIIQLASCATLALILILQVGCDTPLLSSIPDPSFDSTRYWEVIAFAILAAGLLWTLALITRDIRLKLKKKDDLLPAPLGRILLIRLMSYIFLAGTVILVMRTAAHPANLIPYLISFCWFTSAFLLTLIFKRLSNKLPILLISIVLPDVAFIVVILFFIQQLNYLPNLLPIIVSAAYLHICFFTFSEVRRFLIFKRTFFALAVFVILAFGPPLKQQSTILSKNLDLPGRANRISGTDGKIFSVFVDQKSGYIYYLRKENPGTIYGLQPVSGQRVSFHDKRERFSNLVPGPGDTMLATSSAPRGRSALLFDLPDLNVDATFTAFNLESEYVRYGPPAYDAVFSSDYIYLLALGEGQLLINRCQLPVDGSPPMGDLGRNCFAFGLPVDKPGALFLDEETSYLYVVNKGSMLNPNSSLIQIFSKDMEKRKETKFPGAIADLTMSADRKALYASLAWEKIIYFFAAQNPTKGFMAPIHIFPTRVIADSFKQYLYVGSSFYGAIQILRLSDGWASHPIITGPGLNDMAIDETRQILYVATDTGVIAVNLKMIPMPTGAMRIEPYKRK